MKLTIDFPSFVKTSIGKGDSWLIQCSDSNYVNMFFDWLEGKKYHSGASAEFADNNEIVSDLYVISKYVTTLRFRLSDNESTNFYYQQRYHATENDNVVTLQDYIGNVTDSYFEQIAGLFGLDKLLDEKINMLSSGEFRKAYILKSAMTYPPFMFIEEPYTGIDAASCKLLNRLFEHLVQNGTSVVIFTSGDQKPDFISHTLRIGDSGGNDQYDAEDIDIPANNDADFIHAFELKNITAGYNGRDVLHNVSWSVSRNQKWSLTGHNGAGKSTLLSFVYADNPQVYSNEVYLFGKRRGTGEAIWDVKDRIGFYSSELHRYFNKLQSVESAINSILFQNPYEKRVLSASEENFRLQLLRYFNLDSLGSKLLCDLSIVNQKLVILSAVLLKNAPLVILDEPFQGFSDQLIKKSLALINRYIENRTFIMVSHNNADFPDCIDKHFALKNGRVEEEVWSD